MHQPRAIIRAFAILAAALIVCPVLGAEPDAGGADFLRDVVPALTKAGCNAGSCHGSFKGRGGLTLSLVVLLIWIYYSAQILLYGAEITHVLWASSRDNDKSSPATQINSRL